MGRVKLTNREKRSVLVAVLLLGGLVGCQLIALPMHERLTTLKRVVSDKEQTLTQLKRMSEELNAIRSEASQFYRLIEAQPDSGRMLSLLERINKETELSRHITHMNPSTVSLGAEYKETSIEIKLQDISLEQIITYLNSLKDLELAIGVTQLEIRRNEKAKGILLEAIVHVSTVSSSV